MEEGGGGLGKGGKTVVELIGVGVAGKAFGQLTLVVVGLHHRAPLMVVRVFLVVDVVIGGVGVHHVPEPRISVVVNVVNKESGARQTLIPAGHLTVFEHEELIGVGIVIDDESLAAFAQGFHTADERIS